MKKNVFLPLLALAITFSCSNESYEEMDDISNNSPISQKSFGDEKYEVLGYGYDITGEFLSTSSLRRLVLDIDLYEKSYKDRLYNDEATWGYDAFYSGGNSVDYLTDIARKGGLTSGGSFAKIFSGTFNASGHFNSKYSYSSKYSFASLDLVRNTKIISVNDSPNRLGNYLSRQFKEDLERYSMDRIVEIYGTHVLTDFKVGGRYKLTYRSAITSEASSSSKKVAVESGFAATLKVIKINANTTAEIQIDKELTEKNENQELFVSFYGGNGTNLKYDLEKNIPTSVDVEKWENQLTKGRKCITEINWKETLPIYEFVSNPDKREKLKAAVEAYIERSKLEYLDLKPMYELESSWWEDRYYLYSKKEADSQVAEHKDICHGVVGYILANPELGKTKPLFSMCSLAWEDRYYLFSKDEVNNQVNKYDEYWGLDGYIYTNEYDSDLIPVYEMYSSGWEDRYFVFSISDANYQHSKYKDKINGLVGYIYQP